MIFETKVAIAVLDDLPVWQKLNVTAFLATGIAGAAPEAMGEPYEDAAGRRHARLLGQPMLIFAGGSEGLLRAWRVAIERELTLAVYVRAMSHHRARCGEPGSVQGRAGGCAGPGGGGAARCEEGGRSGDQGVGAAPVILSLHSTQ